MIGLILLLGSLAQADSYRMTLTDGSAKSFATKPEAVRYLLLNEKSVRDIEETRKVVLTEKLSFKKASGR